LTDNRTTYYCSTYEVTGLYRPGKYQEAIALAADSGSGQANKNRIYLSAANTLPFTPGDVVLIYDNNNLAGETVQIQDVVSSGASPYLETVSDLSGNYTTTASAKVRLLSYFTSRKCGNSTSSPLSATTPSSEEVYELISQAEQYIETRTRTAFRLKTVTEETHHWPMYQYRPQDWLDGLMIPLNHRMVRYVEATDGSKILSSADGDKLEVFSGSDWDDWLTTFTGGRSRIHALDPVRGVIFLRSFYRLRVRFAVRITYRYGFDTVPADIRRATALLTAAKLLETEDSVVEIPGGGDLNIVPVETRSKRYQEEAEKIITKYMEPWITWI